MSPIGPTQERARDCISVHFDITESREADRRAAEAAAMLEDLTEYMPGFLFRRRKLPSGEPEFVFASRSLARLLEIDEVPGTLSEYYDYVHPDDLPMLSGRLGPADEGAASTGEYRLVTRTGRLVWVRTTSVPRLLPSGETVWDGCAIDVTMEHDAQARLAYLRERDALTGLSNRESFETLLAGRLALRASRPRLIAVIEIGGLAELRDILEPGAVDEALRQIADRLKHVCDDADLGRLGEYQFALATLSSEPAQDTASRLRTVVERPVAVGDNRLRLHAHVGVAMATDQVPVALGPRSLAEELLREAHIALIEARNSTQGSGIYMPDLEARISHRLRLRQELAADLDLRQFHLVYQPQVMLSSGRVCGAEALLRWTHPRLGSQPADLFVPLAEETGAIVQLGEFVLDQAIEQARLWRAEGWSISMAVNVSAVQLQDAGFAERVGLRLAAAGLPGPMLELELTETALIVPSALVDANIADLRRLGVGIAIDDFGAGHATLQYLKRFPAQRMKVDRSFVAEIGRSAHGDAVIRGLLGLVRTMGLAAIFEGIETSEQHVFLRNLGARYGQGYLFSRPRLPEAFAEFVAAQGVAPVALHN